MFQTWKNRLLLPRATLIITRQILSAHSRASSENENHGRCYLSINGFIVIFLFSYPNTIRIYNTNHHDWNRFNWKLLTFWLKKKQIITRCKTMVLIYYYIKPKTRSMEGEQARKIAKTRLHIIPVLQSIASHRILYNFCLSAFSSPIWRTSGITRIFSRGISPR